jgi:hypothetical protein
MSKPIYETKYLGSRIAVFPDHVDWKISTISNSIMVSQISSVELPPLIYAIDVISTSGKRYRIPVKRKEKESVRDAILAQVGNASVSGHADSAMDELKKLAELKAAGVVTQEEFEKKKRELLQS